MWSDDRHKAKQNTKDPANKHIDGFMQDYGNSIANTLFYRSLSLRQR